MIFKSKLPASPYIIWAAVFTLIPLLLVGYYAFTDSGGNFTIINISDVSKFGPVFIRSVLLGLIATAVCLILAYPFAFIMSRMNAGMQKIMMMLILLPMWMNFILRTYALMTLLEKIDVFVNRFSGFAGLGHIQIINSGGAVVMGMVYNYLPFMILPLYTVMIKIDKSVIEAAQDLGANTMGVVVKIVLPLSKPGILSGITMVFVPSVSTFVISRMLGGGANFLVGDLIEQLVLGTTYNLQLGSAISFILMIFILLSMALLNQFDADETEGMIV
ncbi:MAG: ABC transporter permease [Oscillospiraceae bacterium]|nr:ABC transporter permease [Oscillospiraceae bacterium]